MGVVWLGTSAYDVAPTSEDTWQDRDLDSYIGGLDDTVTGAIIHMVDVNGNAVGLRKNGSNHGAFSINASGLNPWCGWFLCGVDSSHLFEVYKGYQPNLKMYLRGYTTRGFGFFDSEIDKSTATTGSWVDVDCSSDVPSNAIGVICAMRSSSTGNFGFRINGSSYNVPRGNVKYNQFMVGLDNNKIFEQYISHTGQDLKLLGYVIEGSGWTFLSNPQDWWQTDDQNWEDHTAATGAEFLYLNIYWSTTSDIAFAARSNDANEQHSSDASGGNAYTGTYAYIPTDSSFIFETNADSGHIVNHAYYNSEEEGYRVAYGNPCAGAVMNI